MALSIFEEAFARERTKQPPIGRRKYSSFGRYDSQQGEEFVEAAARVLGAVQTVCDALIPPSQGRYTVGFGGKTAMTEIGRKRISLTPQPLYMKGLRLADVADTLTGFVVHEIGHVHISQATDEAVEAWLAREPVYRAWRKSILQIANVIDDVALERWARNRFPGVAHTFRVTTKFVAQEGGLPNKPPRRWDPKYGYAERFSFAVVAVRYRWFTRWVGDAATRAERGWWVDWADRYGDPADVTVRMEGVRAALVRIATHPEKRQPEPEPQPSDEQGEPEPSDDEGDEDESESEPGESEDESEPDEPETFDTSDEGEDADDAPTSGGNDDDEPEDDEDADEGEDDLDDEGEDADDDADEGDDGDDDDDGYQQGLGRSEDGTADDGPDDDEGDEPFGPEDDDEDGESDETGRGTDAGDSGDDDDDLDDEDDGPDSDERQEGAHLNPMDESDLGDDGTEDGSSTPPVYEGFQPEDLRNTVQNVDEYEDERQRYDRSRDDQLQEKVEVEMKVQKVTDPHGYGTMKVVINL